MKPVRASRRFLLLTTAAVVAFLLVPSAAEARGKDPHRNYRLLSRFWLPYKADPPAVGLFHLDQGRKTSIKEIEQLEKERDPLAALGPTATSTKKVQGEPVADSSLLKRDATLVGEFEWIAKGKFSNAVRLKGRGAMIRTPVYPEVRAKAFTVEAWLKRTEDRAAVLFSTIGPGDEAPIELRCGPDGAMELRCVGELVGRTKLPLPRGAWRHVTLLVSPPRSAPGEYPWAPIELGPQARVLLDGLEVLEVQSPKIAAGIRLCRGVFRIGNDTSGKLTFGGEIDEVRLSSELRTFYPLSVDWVDTERKRPLPTGQPYLRDRDDAKFLVSFEETLQPQKASGAVIGQPNWPRGYKVQPPPDPHYRTGVRGRALVIQPGRRMHIYEPGNAVNPRHGSIEFWFRPWDWDNRKQQAHHDPMEFTHILRVETDVKPEKGKTSSLCAFGIFRKMPLEKPRPPMIHPGHWYHVVGTWEEGRGRIYMNGKPMHPSIGYWRVSGLKEGAKLTRITINPFRHWVTEGKQTLLDELRIYDRALTPEEIANAYRRFLPEPELEPLPFAHVDLAMNHPMRTLDLSLELLSEKRGSVAAVDLKARREGREKALADLRIDRVENGRAAVHLKDVDVAYGPHSVKLTFLDANNKPLGDMDVRRDRPRPPWLGFRGGIHPGKVLPGWTPMESEGATVRCWGRELRLDNTGLPAAIISQGENMLAAPMALKITLDGRETTLSDNAPATAEKANDALVVTRGTAKAGSIDISTRITTEFDGMMKIETTLTPRETVQVDRLKIEIPMRTKNAAFLGFWTGHRNFRWSTDYRLLPDKEGVLFSSLKPGRAVNKAIVGSFIPYVFLGNDYRGIAWFAENDQGWTKSEEVSAVEVERVGEVTTLRMNVFHEATELREPLTLTFGLHPVPVKPRPANSRSLALEMNFGFVDSFSKQHLKTNGNDGNFNIYPIDYDWKAAAARADLHREFYKHMHGYRGPILYIDRNWVGLPPNTNEFRGRWYRSGFFRYIPNAADCHIWHMDQWLKHKLIRGFYIDDMWIGQFRDPETGPGYRLPDGKIQVGFEFFDHHAYMKRLRWIFHENGQEPLIWVHMTQTFYVPSLSFVDVYLDGEDRFLNWYDKRNFIVMWGLPRLRFNNAKKWGLIPVWMNKIGNDTQPRIPAPHWLYSQTRAYLAGISVHDITNVNHLGGAANAVRDFRAAGCLSDEAEFVGYWEPHSPVRSDRPQVVASIFKTEGKTALLVVNAAREAQTASLTLDPKGFGADRMDQLTIEDADTYDPPQGEDITKLKTMEKPKETALGEGGLGLEEEFAEIKEETDRIEAREKGVFEFGNHNFRLDANVLKLKVRPCDYRLLLIKPKRR